MSAFELPQGLFYVGDFISKSEEIALVSRLDNQSWNGELKRRVQHFGYRYDYRARTVTRDAYLGPLPDWMNIVCDRLMRDGYLSSRPDQVIANEYLPGQGISAHVDCAPCFGERIVSLSLLSPCEMVFRQIDSKEVRSVILDERSVICLSGAARYDWTHEIPARLSDAINGHRHMRHRRISLTFRNVIAHV